jgi:hypothetical protein
MVRVRQNGQRIRRETGQALAGAGRLVHEMGEANRRAASQTRQTLVKSRQDLRGQTRRTMAAISELLSAIRSDVTVLKADAGRITTEARDFLAQTGSDNAKLRVQTHKRLASARAQSQVQARQTLAEAGQVMVETKTAVAELKAQTGRMLAEAADVMKGLCAASRHRAAAWQDIIRSMQNGRSPAAGGAALPTAASAGPVKAAVRRPRPSTAKSRKRKVS